MTDFSDNHKLIDDALASLNKSDRTTFESVLPKYWSLVALDEIADWQSKDLVRVFKAHHEFAVHRRPGEAKVNVASAGEDQQVVVEIVVADSPFLFDSISNAIHDAGFSIALATHPVFWVKRAARGALQGLEAEKPSLKGRPSERDPAYSAEAWLRFQLEPLPNAKTNKALKTSLQKVLSDVNIVVAGWQLMRSKAAEIRFGLEQQDLPINDRERREASAFLEWVEDNNITFISYVRADLVTDASGNSDLVANKRTRLGLEIDASPWAHLEESDQKQAFMRQYLEARTLLVITKANQLSPVHRRAYLDYIAIKRYDKQGNICGEHRFFGLFTRAAYNSRAIDIPLLETRIDDALARARFIPGSHNAKMLLQILETFPRDVQFQSTSDELYKTAMGVLALDERNRVRVFARLDPFRRFYSLLIYLPRERYSQQVREKIQDLVGQHCDSTDMDFHINFNESTLARLQLIVRLQKESEASLDASILEQEVDEITRNWGDALRKQLVAKHPRKEADGLHSKWAGAFSAAYIAKTKPEIAAADIHELQALAASGERLSIRMLPDPENRESRVQIRGYFRDEPLALAEAQPRLANLGLRLLFEDLFPVELDNGESYWVQDLRAESALPANQDLCSGAKRFEQAFIRLDRGELEDDWFNKLVLAAALDWRQAGLIRAYSRYLKQLGSSFGQIYISQTLAAHGDITAMLVKLFEARFNPSQKKREAAVQDIDDKLLKALDGVSSLDADRILRSVRSLIMNTLRTNYFQRDENNRPPVAYVFKFATRNIEEAPRPRPMYEIWLHSPRVEAVHLRNGKVARGGLRWSDRPEDFRTEVLGLVKAQIVKNSVIVPVGAKGGFVCRQLPENGDRAAIQTEVKECYRWFMRGMLSITDNLVNDKLVPPQNTVRHDGDDPYLVVAADKGTATFSDTANGIAEEQGFWIGDAFASGGSNGYDHKKMGITAKGAWESVKRHFRELGTNIQEEEFSVVGVGDMGGDVFGNGMLLSKHVRLLAAFNHMHIFIDPNPDVAVSYAERERLFKDVSGWGEYNLKLLSNGGGIYSRKEKSIKPSAAACKALDLEARSYTPDELIHQLLQAPVDLFWNGGIGTYIKAESESHADTGDRANDAVRVNGKQVRARVLGEGGNLGVTQLGRVEYSLAGGLCNTDFIDNSGGVDSSDAEVNIKILLNPVVASGNLTLAARNKLLKSMTEDVKSAVLRNNYLQSQSISLLASTAPERLGEHAELIRILERDAGLDRRLEFLPDEKNIQQRQSSGLGLTRPEIAVLVSYAKIELYNELLDSDVPEDEYLSRELVKYFPKALSKKFGDAINNHRLKREIICTCITNSMVNRMGAAFALRMHEEVGCSIADIARSYTIARDVFQMRNTWRAIEELDYKVSASTQLELMRETNALIKHTTLWLVQSDVPLADIERIATGLEKHADGLDDKVGELISDDERKVAKAAADRFQSQGVPAPLAKRIAGLKTLYAVPDISYLTASTKGNSGRIAQVYFSVSRRLHLDWIRRQIDGLRAESRWQALARNALRDDLYARHRSIAHKAIAAIDSKKPVEKEMDQWQESVAEQTGYLLDLVAELKAGDNADYLSLSVVLRQLGRLAG